MHDFHICTIEAYNKIYVIQGCARVCMWVCGKQCQNTYKWYIIFIHFTMREWIDHFYYSNGRHISCCIIFVVVAVFVLLLLSALFFLQFLPLSRSTAYCECVYNRCSSIKIHPFYSPHIFFPVAINWTAEYRGKKFCVRRHIFGNPYVLVGRT